MNQMQLGPVAVSKQNACSCVHLRIKTCDFFLADDWRIIIIIIIIMIIMMILIIIIIIIIIVIIIIYLSPSPSLSLSLSLSLVSLRCLVLSLTLSLSLSLSLSSITARHPQASCRLSALFLSSFSRLALLCFPLLCIALLCFALLCFTLLCYALVLRTTEATEASSPSRRHSDESYKRDHRQNRSPLQHHKTERKLEGCPAVQH